MHYQKNMILQGADRLPIALDIFCMDEKQKKPVIIYAHGFNGFKDWGNLDLMAEQVTAAGFVLVKFNFSHNGTSPQHPETFVNLEAFGNNNYSKQLTDLSIVIDWTVSAANPFAAWINAESIFLIGHSMGGGMVILKAASDARVKKIVTWAAISECKTPWGSWPQEKLADWKQTGIAFYRNGRTGQEMPLYYQLFEDYQQNSDALNIKKATSKLQIPVLLCHGSEDPSVPVEKAMKLKTAQPAAELFLVKSDHVFGRKHPWEHPFLPEPMQAVLNKTLDFLKD